MHGYKWPINCTRTRTPVADSFPAERNDRHRRAPPRGSHRADAYDSLEVGAAVEARFSNGSWYAAEVVDVSAGSYSVKFDDGVVVEGLGRSDVQAVPQQGQNRGSSPDKHGAHSHRAHRDTRNPPNKVPPPSLPSELDTIRVGRGAQRDESGGRVSTGAFPYNP